MRYLHATACATFIVSLLTACGGGGGGGGSSAAAPAPSPAPNQAPIAEAGANLSVNPGSVVTLDGSDSRDPDGSIASYAWSQSGGPQVDLEGANQPSTSFTAPNVSRPTDFSFLLTVTDDEGSSASDSVNVRVEVPEGTSRVRLSGTVTPAAGHDRDSDTNDEGERPLSNDSPGQAQPISNPVTLGGYVNQPGQGADGPLSLAGDTDDFFRVNLLQGQQVTLLVADFFEADADLFLLDSAGVVVDFSVDTGELERVTVPQDGEYLINVFAFTGGTSYTLAIGSNNAAFVASAPDIVPWQAVVHYQPDTDGNDSQALSRRESIERRLGTRHRRGGEGRARLMTMRSTDASDEHRRNRLGTLLARTATIADEQQRTRLETLYTIKAMSRLPGVASAEPNYRLKAHAIPNDEAYPIQWHYPLIQLPTAWNTTVGSPEAIVAVIDTGILSAHPDLAGQLVPGYDFVSPLDLAQDGDGIDPNPEDPGGNSPATASFHGTHVAGTVAARGNNGIGGAGVAYGARIMPIRALGEDSGTSFDVNQAIRFAAGLPNDSGTVPAQPASVINLSLGGGGFSQAEQNLVNEVRSRGIVVVASAGNESTAAPAYPASYDGVISVSAVDLQRRLAGYSNTGSRIDVAAPGGDGSVDLNGDGYPDGVLSTGASGNGFTYRFLSGTSMAAPHVAGVIALMQSVNPNLTPDQVDQLLRRGELTDDLGAAGRDDRFGHGLINAEKAVRAALALLGEQPDIVALVSSSTNSLNFGRELDTLEFTLSANDQAQVLGITTDVPWLAITPVATDSNGLGTYAAALSRGDLLEGIYRGTITVTADANTLTLQALLAVGQALETDVGLVYVLLLDPETDTVVDQSLARAEDNYRFVFEETATGRYQIAAGTDIDNDLFICDPGEACGAFLTLDQPLTVELDRDRGDIEVPIEYLIAIPTTNDAGRETATLKPRLPAPSNGR
ncbi:S8 family peptidase [Halioglobus pacificus]|uniref:PKD/Chitinase domain-containing protein n=1 Tax=Parahalioglobus pacificus TaxID=930806 RepID=A0A919CL77_9GAMM|nr:S8 family peptidase [Halioglobus pacificus]GHD35628.1 hypothetical protein GCM10007053_22820 [Halioglobus pacificus]